MATYNKFNSFSEAVCEKVHNLGADTLTVALCATANAPVATNAVLADLTQIAYTNFGTRTLTVSSSSQSSGTYKLIITDKVISVSGGAGAAFRYIVIYNDTALNDELICWFDYGSSLTLADGEQITLDFDATNGLFTLA